jgi:hypothetical protein
MYTSKKVTNLRPFCKVCFDSGKEESIYTSHFVRSEPGANSKVICPTLLAQECTYCRTAGHTVKFCKVLIIRKKEDDRYASRVRYDRVNIIPVMATSTKKRNTFAVLDDSDSETEPKEEFPQLCVPVKYKIDANVSTYASMAAAASDTVLPRANAKSSASSTPFRMFRAGGVDDDANDCISDVTIYSAHRPNRSVAPKREIVSWADWSDSESEYDVEEEYQDSIS